jgi:peptide-methionine (S)-S-oxide reductase
MTRISPEGVFWQDGPEHQDYLQRFPNVFRAPFPRQDEPSPQSATGVPFPA